MLKGIQFPVSPLFSSKNAIVDEHVFIVFPELSVGRELKLHENFLNPFAPVKREERLRGTPKARGVHIPF